MDIWLMRGKDKVEGIHWSLCFYLRWQVNFNITPQEILMSRLLRCCNLVAKHLVIRLKSFFLIARKAQIQNLLIAS